MPYSKRAEIGIMDEEVIGFYNNREKIERGWLTTETALQLKLFNNPIQMWKSKLQGRTVGIFYILQS